MVSNTSGEKVTADVFLDVLGEHHRCSPLDFAPHETKVLSVTGLLEKLKLSRASAPEGGITILGRGPKPALIAQGKITDAVTGFSTTLNFPDPALQLASALHASGVPVGTPTRQSPYAGTGAFVPHVVVRNLLDTPQSVILTIEYPGDKGPQQVVLTPVSLEPYTTRDISLDGIFGLLPLPLPFCSIRIQYSGPAGSVIGEVSSVEQRGDLVIDSRLANEGDGWAGSGGHPWHLDDETESILFLTNMGDRECPIGFRMQAGGVHYFLTDLTLKPHETRVIDLRKLRDAQEPDADGHTIPPGASDGTVLWIRLDDVPVMGRLVVLQRHRGMASNYDCGTCSCPACYLWVDTLPDAVDMVPQMTKQLTARAYFLDCNSTMFWTPATGGSFWESDWPSVATVNNHGSKGLVTANSPGDTGIYATYSARWCDDIPPCGCYYVPDTDSSAVSVQNPTITATRQTLTSTSASGSPPLLRPILRLPTTRRGRAASRPTQPKTRTRTQTQLPSTLRRTQGACRHPADWRR
jgi:hypothetical protein